MVADLGHLRGQSRIPVCTKCRSLRLPALHFVQCLGAKSGCQCDLERTPMRRIPVRSRMIKTIAFDEVEKELEIYFHNGKVRYVSGISTEVVAALLLAASPGNYYLDHIRKQYPRRSVRERAA